MEHSWDSSFDRPPGKASTVSTPKTRPQHTVHTVQDRSSIVPGAHGTGAESRAQRMPLVKWASAMFSICLVRISDFITFIYHGRQRFWSSFRVTYPLKQRG